jgi:hypothetical protein
MGKLTKVSAWAMDSLFALLVVIGAADRFLSGSACRT